MDIINQNLTLISVIFLGLFVLFIVIPFLRKFIFDTQTSKEWEENFPKGRLVMALTLVLVGITGLCTSWFFNVKEKKEMDKSFINQREQAASK